MNQIVIYSIKKNYARFQCPSCHEWLNTEISDAGKPDRCPCCNTGFISPAAVELAQRIDQERLAETEQQARAAEIAAQARAKQERESAERIAAERSRISMAKIDDPPPMPTVTTQTCRFCRSEIDAEARKCPRCQEWLDGSHRTQAVVPTVTFHPGVAAALSFFIPGLGQIYKTQVGLGLLWLIVVLAGYAFFIIPGLMLHLICIAHAASIEPIRGR